MSTFDETKVTTVGLFMIGRTLVIMGIALAMHAGPDLAHEQRIRHEARRAQPVAKFEHESNVEWCQGEIQAMSLARIESFIALLTFMSRPVLGSLIDAYGRRPALIAGCAVSALARSQASTHYVLYRVLNALAFVPVMQASSALLADACGRGSEYHIRVNRRMWMWLAFVRVLTTRLALRIHGSDSHAWMTWASRASFAAAGLFWVFSKETLKSDTVVVFKGVHASLMRSATVFNKSSATRWLACLILLRSLPMFLMTPTQVHQRETLKWGLKERARLAEIDAIAEISVPLIVIEAFGLKYVSLEWAMRLSALSALNVGLTPVPWTIYANPFIERIVQGQPVVELMLNDAFPDMGNAGLEAAVSTIEFPIAFLAPNVFARLTSISTRLPFVLVASTLLMTERFVLPRVRFLLKNVSPNKEL